MKLFSGRVEDFALHAVKIKVQRVLLIKMVLVDDGQIVKEGHNFRIEIPLNVNLVAWGFDIVYKQKCTFYALE